HTAAECPAANLEEPSEAGRRRICVTHVKPMAGAGAARERRRRGGPALGRVQQSGESRAERRELLPLRRFRGAPRRTSGAAQLREPRGRGGRGSMTDVTEPRPGAPGSGPERRAAHERLSTGALAGWARANAAHPWRVIGVWIGSAAVRIALVATVGGALRDEFEIPGSETQKATDLIESQFASEQGSVLNIVFAAPEGQRLDTPERKQAIEAAIAKLKTSEFKPTGKDPDGNAGIDSVGDPFSKDTFSDNGRIAYAEAQFDRIIYA